MIFSKDTIMRNSRQLFHNMRKMSHYTFSDLQGGSHLNDTELCLAIGQLMQEGKVTQYRDAKGIYYEVA